jgi:hypothetical protein
LIVSGIWIQNVDMQKMKLQMFNYLQQLPSSNLILVEQWKRNKNLSNLPLFLTC